MGRIGIDLDLYSTIEIIGNRLANIIFFQNVQSENDNLNKTLDKVQNQLDTSLDKQEQQCNIVLEYLTICEVNFELYLEFSLELCSLLEHSKKIRNKKLVQFYY